MEPGEVIRYLRKRDGLSQQELAEQIGLDRSALQKVEAGQTVNLKLGTIQKLCKVFRVAPFAFVFPDAWHRSQMEYRSSPDFYVYTAKHSRMTDEWKQKGFDYVNDIGDVDRYIRKDAEDYEELHKLFLQIGDRNHGGMV